MEALDTQAAAPGGITPVGDTTDFRLQSGAGNPLVDAAAPLLGLVLRARRMDQCRDVETLYQQVVGEVTQLSSQLMDEGMERAELMAYRYVLCAFIDEAMLSTEWGSFSIWAQHSLLSRFHNETWGGEKVFSILGKLEQEPERYRNLLEFIHLCLALGFQGKYRIRSQDQQEYESIRAGLYDLLYGQSRGQGQALSDPFRQVVTEPIIRSRGMPVWGVFTIFAVVMAGVYGLYRFALSEHMMSVMAVLDALPQ